MSKPNLSEWWRYTSHHNLTYYQLCVFLCMWTTSTTADRHTLLSNKSIAERVGSNRKSVETCIRQLREMGLVGKATKIDEHTWRRDLLVEYKSKSEALLAELEEVAELKKQDAEQTKYDWKV